MDNRMKIKWIIFGFIITWLFFSYKEAMSDDWSRKSVGQGVGGFLGVLSTQLMEINNPYALATGGLLVDACMYNILHTTSSTTLPLL